MEKEDTTERLVVYDQRVTVKEVSVSTFERLEPFKVPFVLINAMVCTLYIIVVISVGFICIYLALAAPV